MLLVGDTHFDDNPANEYRWQVFDWIEQHLRPKEPVVFMGDLVDKRDRHSGALINRVVRNISHLAAENHGVVVLMGNHDAPINGPPYWHFLNEISGVRFVAEPLLGRDAIFLPYAPKPADAWRELLPLFHKRKAIFIHQTLHGCRAENGLALQADDDIIFPRGLRVYAGDVHVPQTVQTRVVYVGAPYPIKFGDNYDSHFLRLDDDFNIEETIALPSIRKTVARIQSLAQLDALPTGVSDQVRIELALAPQDLEQWPHMREEIGKWAAARGVQLERVEVKVQTGNALESKEQITDSLPENILRAFATAESLDEALLQSGLDFLRENS